MLFKTTNLTITNDSGTLGKLFMNFLLFSTSKETFWMWQDLNVFIKRINCMFLFTSLKSHVYFQLIYIKNMKTYYLSCLVWMGDQPRYWSPDKVLGPKIPKAVLQAIETSWKLVGHYNLLGHCVVGMNNWESL